MLSLSLSLPLFLICYSLFIPISIPISEHISPLSLSLSLTKTTNPNNHKKHGIGVHKWWDPRLLNQSIHELSSTTLLPIQPPRSFSLSIDPDRLPSTTTIITTYNNRKKNSLRLPSPPVSEQPSWA